MTNIKQTSLKEFYNQYRQTYDSLPVKDALITLQDDYVREFAEVIKPETTNLIVVKNISEVLSQLDFDWVVNHSKDDEIKYFDSEGELISNLSNFYAINEDLLASKTIESILDEWGNLIQTSFQNTGSFANNRYNTTITFVYIKASDVEDYNNNVKFDHKQFGDKSCRVCVNFIFKPGDNEFELSNLNEQIKMAKLIFYSKR